MLYSAQTSNDVATVRASHTSARLSDTASPSSCATACRTASTARWVERKLKQRRKELMVLLLLPLLCYAWQWADDVMFQLTAFFDAIDMEQLLVLPSSLHWGTILYCCVTLLSFDSARTLSYWLTPWHGAKMEPRSRWEMIPSACALAFVMLTLFLLHRR